MMSNELGKNAQIFSDHICAGLEAGGLDPDDYVGNPDAVIALLSERKALLQRPIVVKGKKAIIGRPKARIREFIG